MNQPNDMAPGSGEGSPRSARHELADCQAQLASCRRELAATQSRLEESEELATQVPRLRQERDKLATALAGYLSRPPIVLEPTPLPGWRGWLVRRLSRNAPARIPEALDPRIEQIESSPLFDAAWYLRTYPDVAAAGERPAVHFLHHGFSEGRSPGPDFDTAFYLARYRDVREAGMNPLIHYELVGRNEGRLTAHPQLGPAGAPSRI